MRKEENNKHAYLLTLSTEVRLVQVLLILCTQEVGILENHTLYVGLLSQRNVNVILMDIPLGSCIPTQKVTVASCATPLQVGEVWKRS